MTIPSLPATPGAPQTVHNAKSDNRPVIRLSGFVVRGYRVRAQPSALLLIL